MANDNNAGITCPNCGQSFVSPTPVDNESMSIQCPLCGERFDPDATNPGEKNSHSEIETGSDKEPRRNQHGKAHSHLNGKAKSKMGCGLKLLIVVLFLVIFGQISKHAMNEYIRRSRFAAIVYPAAHQTMMKIADYYLVKRGFDGLDTEWNKVMDEVEMRCSRAEWNRNPPSLIITIDTTGNANDCNSFSKYQGEQLLFFPQVDARGVKRWKTGGKFAKKMGMVDE